MKIREIDTDEELQEPFPILQQLRSHLDYEKFKQLYDQMVDEGYHLFCGYHDSKPVAVAGVTLSTNFYFGRHAYLYDLVTDEEYRSRGFGSELLEHVHEWAHNQGCEAIELESGHWRDEAHRFYTEQMDYEKYCYSFKYDY